MSSSNGSCGSSSFCCRIYGTYLLVIAYLVYLVTVALISAGVPVGGAVVVGILVFAIGPPVAVFTIFVSFVLLFKFLEFVYKLIFHPYTTVQNIITLNWFTPEVYRDPNDPIPTLASIVSFAPAQGSVQQSSAVTDERSNPKHSETFNLVNLGKSMFANKADNTPVAAAVVSEGDAVAALQVTVERQRYSNNPYFPEHDEYSV